MEIKDLEIPESTYVDKHYLANALNVDIDTITGEMIDEAKRSFLVKNEQAVIIRCNDKHSLFIKSFVALNYNTLRDITDGKLLINVENKDSAGILIGKHGKNLAWVRSMINTSLNNINRSLIYHIKSIHVTGIE